MNQKGFATIFALCMILATALVVKGIQESEMNHAYETANFQAEVELQNIADSAIYEAAEMVRLKKIIIQPNGFSQRNPVKIPVTPPKSDKFRSITVDVWGEYGVKLNEYVIQNIHHRQIIYLPKNKVRYTNEYDSDGYILFSVAEGTNKQNSEKIYRRAFAYVLDNDEEKTIHFMTLP